MPKDIHTPRDELICGKIDKAYEMLSDLAHLLKDIQHDAQRMEAALVRRKEQVREQEQPK